jgi:hypothetical protein
MHRVRNERLVRANGVELCVDVVVPAIPDHTARA